MKNNVVRMELWHHEERFVYSMYFSMRGSLNTGRSVNAAHAQRG